MAIGSKNSSPKKENMSRSKYYLKRSLFLLSNKGPKEFSKEGFRFIYRNSPFPIVFKAVYKKADEFELIDPEDIYSEKYYSKRKNDPYRAESNHIAGVLKERFEPESVIDFGCGIATYLEPFYNDNKQVYGIEGNEKAIRNAVIPNNKLEHFDLRNAYEIDEKYGLALSIEVAEHIPEKFSDNFVKSICSSSKETIIMTAAPPGQGGTHHVNEKPREYWIEKFEKEGFTYKKDLVEELREEIDVEFLEHVPKNLFVFKKEDKL